MILFNFMNNSVFGKTMENVRNGIEMHMTTNDENATKWFSKPTLKNCIETFGLYLIEMYQTEITLDKPIYDGTTILDLSKLLMMRFHYDVVRKHFNGKSELLYSDTDSLVYHIFVDDLYEWMKENKNLFDLSEFIRDDIKDDTNKKKLGVMKDELKGLPIHEFISLGPKCYSFTYKENVEKILKRLRVFQKQL